MKLMIKNATIYDPKNGTNGETGNLYIHEGRIVNPFRNPDRVIDAEGLVALPGAIEAGSVLASYGLSLYAFQTGIPLDPERISVAYARMGYTHLHESLMLPSTALAIHNFLASLPYQDGSASLCLALREFGSLIGANTPPAWTVRFLDTCLTRFRALNIRLPEASAHFRESALSRFNIPANKVLGYLSKLPFHAPFLVETDSRLLDEDLPAAPYLFYSHLGRAIDGEYAFKQASTHLASKGIRGDIGLSPDRIHHQVRLEQVMGEEERLSAHVGLRAPLCYTEGTPPSAQTELTLALATHSNFRKNLAFSSLCLGAQAGEFYPLLFKKLFEKDATYGVNDFVFQTRVLPALLLGLEDKGHLGIGAIGDVALYQPKKDRALGETFSNCHTLIKGGVPILEEGRFLTNALPDTRTYYKSHTLSERDFAIFANYFKSYPRLEHLEVPDAIGSWQVLPLPEE